MSEIHYREWHQAATTACGLSAGIVRETGRWSLSWPVVTCGACLNQRARDRYWTHGCGADVLKTTELLLLADRDGWERKRWPERMWDVEQAYTLAHVRFVQDERIVRMAEVRERAQEAALAAWGEVAREHVRRAGSVDEMLKRVKREEAQALADISIAARKLARAVETRERLEAMRSPLSEPGSADQAPAGGVDGSAAEQRSAALSALEQELEGYSWKPPAAGTRRECPCDTDCLCLPS